MSRLKKMLFAAALAIGFCSQLANAQGKHASTVNTCTVIDKPGAYAVGKVIEATQADLTHVILGSSSNPQPAFGCIVITTDAVTLNLAGNVIIGPGTTGTVPTFGVLAIDGLRAVKVHSGSVTNFDIGVRVGGAGNTIEDIVAFRNQQHGIFAGGSAHRVIANIATDNRGVGILVTCPALVLGNAAHGNSTDIQTASDCTRSHNLPRVGDVP